MPNSTDHTQEKFQWQRMIPLGVIILVAIVGFFTLRDYLSFDSLRDNRETILAWRDANFLLAALGFITIYIAIVAFSLPGAAVISLTGGFVFSLFPGVFLNLTGATIGAVLIFLAARMGLGEHLSRKMDNAEGLIGKIKAGLRENETSFLLLMRLVPAFPFFVANLVPALVGTSLSKFAWTTALGIIPGTIVFTWVGSGLGAVFARGESPDLSILWDWQILGPILALCALSFTPIILKKFRKTGAES